jgi:hypothetical protein
MAEKMKRSNKISFLIQTKNEYENFVKITDHLYDLADEIVVVDVGNPQTYKKMLEYKRRKKLNKLRFFQGPDLGSVETLRGWGVKKCRYVWVFWMDTIGELSTTLKSELGNLTSKNYNGYMLIRRLPLGKDSSFDETQLRLFRRSAEDDTGMIHSQPNVSSKVCYLPSDYYFTHGSHFAGAHQPQKINRYFRIEALTKRQSYSDIINFFDDKSSLIKGLFRMKLGISRCSADDEISKFDYTLFALILNGFSVMYYLKHKNIIRNRLPSILRHAYINFRIYDVPKVNHLFSYSKDQRESQLKYSRMIAEAGGVNQLFELEKDSAVKRIMKEYKKSYKRGKNGVDFLEELLAEKEMTQ